MNAFHILAAAVILLSNFPTCRTTYNVSCVPESVKGLLIELWFAGGKLSFDTLEGFKLTIRSGHQPTSTRNMIESYLALSSTVQGTTAGVRFRTFFLCSLTGEYEFYFSCYKECEWFLKESENSGGTITSGNSSVGMTRVEYRKAELSASLTEGHAYYLEIFRYQPEGDGHFYLKVGGPGDNSSELVSKANLVEYQKDGHYETLHPGDWEAWSPCSAPCGPDGRQTRNRSCLTYPAMFTYSAEGYELTESRACNIHIFPCEEECKEALGMESGAISDAQISASTQRDRNHAAILGRLHLQEKTGIWAPAIRDANQWLQIDFISQDMRVTRVATQGRPSAYYLHWVTSYKLQYGSDGVAFTYYRDYGKSACEDKVFAGNSDSNTVVSHDLNPPIRARFIRFRPVTWHGAITMRVEVYGCEGFNLPQCKDQPIGIERGRIFDSQITTNSSVRGHEAHKGRLNHESAWCAEPILPVYLQVALNTTYVICAVATQGNSSNSSSFVQEYQVEFSMDGSIWDFYRSSAGVIKHFIGNNDSYTVQKNVLTGQVYAKYVRIWPTKWPGLPCMRIELYGQVPVAGIEKPPTIQTIKVSDIGAHSVDISWDRLYFYQSFTEIMGYKIIYYLLTDQEEPYQNNVTLTVNSSTTSYRVAGLQRNTTYCVRILAYNACGANGELGNCTEVTTTTDCLPGWILFQSSCYLLLEKNLKNWYNAEIDCLNRNAHLLYIISAEEEEFIDSQLVNTSTVKTVFIGLKENANSSERFPGWSNGDNLTYTNWYNTTAVIDQEAACVVKDYMLNGRWTTVRCLQVLPYICKRKGFYINGTCWEKAVGLETGVIPDNNITASSNIDPSPPSAARLGSHVGWCPMNLTNAFLQVDLENAYYICAVATQGRPEGNFGYVKHYVIQLSLNGKHWTEYEQEFEAANSYYHAKKNLLNSGVVAQFVRFYPKEWHLSPCMRGEIYGTRAKPFPAPTMPPTIHSARGTDSTSIQFSLSPSLPYYAAYEVTVYNVRYWKLETSSYLIREFSPGTVTANLTANLTALDAYTEYCLSAQAVTIHGPGIYGPCITVMTNESVPALPPAEITAHAESSTSIMLSWNPVPPGHENGVVLGYKILYVDQDETQPKLNSTVEANVSSFEVTGLMTFTNYCIQVLAFTRKGDGNMSDCLITLTGEDVPSSPPMNLTVYSTSSTSLSVCWNPVPTEFENGIITGYRVFYMDPAESKPNLKHTVSSTTFSVDLTDLSVYTNYCSQVLAFTRAGDGVPSDCVFASTDEGVPSVAPSNFLVFSADGRTLSLSWDPVPQSEVNGELKGYTILVNDSNHDGTLFVSPCFSSLQLKNKTFSSNTCIRMAAVTKVGLGKMTSCTKIDVAADPSPPKIIATKSLSSSSIKVTWQRMTETQRKGKLEGFYIKYQAVSRGGEPVLDLMAEPNYTAMVCVDLNEVVITNLTSYTTYKVEVAVRTTEGIGNFSEPVYGETCRCSEHLSVSLVPSPLDSLGFHSLTRVIRDLVTNTCGRCSKHSNTKLISGNTTQEDQVSFPVTKTQAFGDTAYSKFIPVLSVPGFVVIEKKSGAASGLLTRVMANSILSFWPVFVIAFVTALLAGIVIWILDSSTNPEHFPRTFFKGAGEGFWWSFITMTTVGYGDRCPQSISAKAFAIAWFLIGLVIFSLFLGSLTAVLTVTMVSMDLNGPSSSKDRKIAVVLDSSEHQMAVKKFRNKIAIGSTFPDLSSMVEALKSGNITSVLLDMYVPVKRKDLFNGSWFHVTDFLEGEISHGVLLQGEAVMLAKEMKSLIVKNNIQTQFLQQNDEEVGYSKETEATSAVLFEPSSPYFLNTMVVSVGLLLLAVACGLLYQACYKWRFGTTTDKETCRCHIVKKDIKKSVETFYLNFSRSYHRIRQKHKEQLINHVRANSTTP